MAWSTRRDRRDHPPGSVATVAGAVLASQLAVGWSNDWLDARRDQLAGRRDKPIPRGAVDRRLVGVAGGESLGLVHAGDAEQEPVGADGLRCFDRCGATGDGGVLEEAPAEHDHLERAVAAGSDRVIAECPQDRTDLVQLYGADPSRIDLVPCGFDDQEFAPSTKAEARRRLGLADSDHVDGQEEQP